MKDINLLVEEDKNVQAGENVPVKDEKPAKTAKAIAVAVLVAVLVGVTLVVPRAYAGILDARLAAMQEELNSSKYDEVKEVNLKLAGVRVSLGDKKNILNSIDAMGYNVDSLLTAVGNNVPVGCTVSSMDYDLSTLKIALKAQDIANIAEFLLNMERLEYLKLSDNSNQISINRSGEYAFSFEVAGKDGK